MASGEIVTQTRCGCVSTRIPSQTPHSVIAGSEKSQAGQAFPLPFGREHGFLLTIICCFFSSTIRRKLRQKSGKFHGGSRK